MKVFIDSNVPMYVAGADHPHKPASLRFLEKVQSGEIRGCTSTEVLQEILYRYFAIGKSELGGKVYDTFVELCPEVFPVNLADTDRARKLLHRSKRISARDAVHASVMLNHGIKWIASFDAGFDTVPGVRRFPLR